MNIFYLADVIPNNLMSASWTGWFYYFHISYILKYTPKPADARIMNNIFQNIS